MARNDKISGREALDAVLRGDPPAMAVIKSLDHSALRAAAAEGSYRVLVTRSGVVAVLEGLLDRAWTPEQAREWASFVRRGYVAGGSDLPIRPIEIDYDDCCEDEISAAVARLDEIGDLVDGEVSTGEILDLLQLLGEP